MKIEANTVQQYLDAVPKDKEEYFLELRQVILDNLPIGFKEELNYGMLGYVVPFDIYPAGYHCDKSKPLPFMNIACQKNFIGFYHMGIYANKELLDWFVDEYDSTVSHKLDMGKSCVRFKKIDEIPLKLIAELVKKVTPADWIKDYESQIKKAK